MRKTLKLVLTILGGLLLAMTVVAPLRVMARGTPEKEIPPAIGELIQRPAQPADEGLFGGVGIARALTAPDDPAIIRSRFVKVRFDILGPQSRSQIEAGTAPAQRLRLNLFEDADFVAIFEYTDVHLSGSYSWVGHLEGPEYGQVILTIWDGLMVGTIRTPHQLFGVREVEGGIHVVYELDQSAFPPEAEPLSADRDEPAAVQGVEKAAADDGSLIDVLVLYTPAARAAAGSRRKMLLDIDEAESWTNLSYSNSEVIQRVRLVPATELSYVEVGGDLKTDLSNLKGKTDGSMDIAHALRHAYAADAVNLVLSTGDYCGRGYQMQTESSAFESSAFSVVKHGNCLGANLSFGHELGHNMGANHDWFVNDGTDLFDYSHGYVRQSLGWRTVMAYNTECVSATTPPNSCTRLAYWSNPDVLHPTDAVSMGVPAGTSTSCSAGDFAPDCDADNRLTLNNTRDTVANFISGSLSPVVYVDWSNTGTEDGSAAHPYNTVTEGAYRAAPGATVSIESGNYSETLVISYTGYLLIDRPMTLIGTNGIVTIGKEE